MNTRESVVPGLLFCLASALLASLVVTLPWNKTLQLSPLTVAIVAGMIVGNSGLLQHWQGASPGLRSSQRTLLRAGIVLYGLRLTVHDLAALGPTALVIDLLIIGTILPGGYWFGTRILGIDSDTTLLVCSGSAICGAAAVLATDRVIEGESHKVSIAVGTVVLFGTLAMFLYPVLYPFTGFADRQFGVYLGSTVHEVAQVVAAGRAVSAPVADIAVVTKMVRVLLLAPVLMLVGRLCNTRSKRQTATTPRFPWFVLGFAAVIILQSLISIPGPARARLLDLDTILLASAMFALGAGTRWSQIKGAGTKPLLLGAVLFGALISEGYVLASVFLR